MPTSKERFGCRSLATLFAIVCGILMSAPVHSQVIGLSTRVGGEWGGDCEPAVALWNGRAAAAWDQEGGYVLRSGSYLPDETGWAYSYDGGATWIVGSPLPVSYVYDYVWGRPSMAVDASGKLTLGTIYAVNSANPGRGFAIYRGSLSQSPPVLLGPTFAVIEHDASITIDSPHLICDAQRGYLYLTYTRVNNTNAAAPQLSIQFVRSLDGGATWSAPVQLSPNFACNGSSPAVGPAGELVVVWEDYASQQVVGRKSTDFGASFGSVFAVAPVLDNYATRPPGWQDLLRILPTYPTVQLVPDFPSLAIDRSAGPTRGWLHVTWTDYATGTVGPLTGTMSEVEPNNDFAHATPITIGEDVYGSEVDGHITGIPDGDIFTFTGIAGQTLWIQANLLSGGPSFPPFFDMFCDSRAGITLHGGATFGPSGQALPPYLYTLPADGRYYISMVPSQAFSMSYVLKVRNYAVAPGQAAQDHRDVVMTSSRDGGVTWSPKVRVSDDPPRFDDSFPSVAVDDLGRVHVAWYDRRDDLDCGDAVETYWTWSDDGGQSFRPSQRVSRDASLWDQVTVYAPNIGDHLGLAASDSRAVVLWAQVTARDSTDIYAAVIADVPTGIAVPRFTAAAAPGGVLLQWTVAEAQGLRWFQVERAAAGSSSFAPVGARLLNRGAGEYQLLDPTAAPGQVYQYRLAVEHDDGSLSHEGPLEFTLALAPAVLAWQSVGPNPFAHGLRLALAAPRASAGEVRVFDVQGQAVATLHRGALSAGLTELSWDGRDSQGRTLPAGVYLVRAQYDGAVATRRVIHVN